MKLSFLKKPNYENINGLILSILLHCIIAFFIVSAGVKDEAGQKKPKKESSYVDLVATESKQPKKSEQSKENESEVAIKTSKASDPIQKEFCSSSDKNYKGIGMIFDDFSNIILTVPEYYPGYKAGLRIGDTILQDSVINTPDTLTLTVKRDNKELKFSISKEKICYKKD